MLHARGARAAPVRVTGRRPLYHAGAGSRNSKRNIHYRPREAHTLPVRPVAWDREKVSGWFSVPPPLLMSRNQSGKSSFSVPARSNAGAHSPRYQHVRAKPFQLQRDEGRETPRPTVLPAFCARPDFPQPTTRAQVPRVPMWTPPESAGRAPWHDGHESCTRHLYRNPDR